jgi:AcrR family transcriptional regulator
MARRSPAAEIAPILDSLWIVDSQDGGTSAAMDATLELLDELGFRSWTIEDVAERSELGRTTIYRRFGSRDDLVHLTLAREVRRILTRIASSIDGSLDPVDQAVDGLLLGLALVRESVFARLIDSDPSTFLPFLTTGAEPLIVALRDGLRAVAAARVAGPDNEERSQRAEVIARLAMSLVVTPAPLLTGDHERDRAVLLGIFRPLM